jgi:PAS domain S-box-containing protein
VRDRPPPDSPSYAIDRAAARRDEDLSLALRAADMGWWEWDLPDGEIRWSRGHEDSHGGDSAPLSYAEYLRTVHEDDRDRMDTLIHDAIERRGSYDTEFRTIWPDGSVHWMYGVGRVFCDDDGTPVRLAGVARLIDDERAAREAIAEAEGRFERLANVAPVLLWVSNTEGTCTFVNESLCAFTGRTFEEEIGDGWSDVVHPDDLEPCLALHRAALAERREFEMEYRMRRHDGQYRWVLDRCRPLVDETGAFRGFVGGCVDIHERREAEERTRRAAETRALLDAIYRDAPVGLAFFDAELRYVRVNDALADINGLPAADHLGHRIADLLPDMDPQVERDIARVLETGEPIVDAEVTAATPRRPDRPGHFLVSYYRVALEDGEPLGVALTVLEVTARREAEVERERLLAAEQHSRRQLEAAHARSSFLARLGGVLERSLHLEDTLAEVVALLREELADAVAVDVVERDGRTTTRRGEVSVPGGPDRPEGCPTTRAVPLVARGRHVGAVVLGWREDRHQPSAADARHVGDIAQRLALWIDNALLYREREQVADILQAGLMPPDLPTIPGIGTAARYLPADEATDVGGDFYDLFPTPTGGWALAVGDVCGKGADAAAVTAMARYTLRAATAAGGSDPDRDLGLLNDGLLAEDTPERFLTAVLAHVDAVGPDGHARVRIACAGHPSPLLLRADGAVEPVAARGPLIGVVPGVRWSVAELDLGPGDALMVATDGVTEADRDAPLDPAALGALLRRELGGAAASADDVASAVESIARRRSVGRLRDDVAVLVLRIDD